MIAEPFAPPELDLVRIFEGQRARYRADAYPSFEHRKANLAKLERAISQRRDAIAAALHADLRKSSEETALTEVIVALAELKHARAGLAKWMRPRAVPASLTTFGSKAEIRHQPKGVVLILSPWNYPFGLTIAPLVAALAAGNRCILRPSEKAPHTRAILAEIVADAFSPDEVALVGGEVDTARALLELPFDHIFFTGSTAVGKIVMRAAAEHLASVTLELGGKSPAIIAPDADLPWAAKRIAWGKFLNAGQTCIAPDYVLVPESARRTFVADLITGIERMYGSTEDARAQSPDLCRVIDDGHFARLEGVLEASLAAGAKLEIGGRTDRASRYFAPTVLSDVGFDSPIMQEEIFGPLLPVITYRSLDEALARINARPKPLALYAFTNADALFDDVVNRAPAGASVRNDTVLHFAHPNLPFGGTGESGMGSYHGHFGFEAFSHERAILRQGRSSLAPGLAPPYTRKTRALLGLLEKLS